MESRSKHQPEIIYKKIGIGTVCFIYHKDVCDLHQACFHGLYFVSTLRNYHHHGYICQTCNLHFTLSYTNSFHDDVIKRSGLQEFSDLYDLWMQSSQ